MQKEMRCYDGKIIRHPTEHSNPQLNPALPQQQEQETYRPTDTKKQTKAPKWLKHEEELLYELHQRYGNKWTLISSQFPGRSDNDVKNYLYSQLRVNFRQLNEHLKSIPKKCRPRFLKNHLIYKLMSVCEDEFQERKEYEDSFIQFAREIKHKLTLHALGKVNQSQEKLRIVEVLHSFHSQLRSRIPVLNSKSNPKNKITSDRPDNQPRLSDSTSNPNVVSEPEEMPYARILDQEDREWERGSLLDAPYEAWEPISFQMNPLYGQQLEEYSPMVMGKALLATDDLDEEEGNFGEWMGSFDN